MSGIMCALGVTCIVGALLFTHAWFVMANSSTLQVKKSGMSSETFDTGVWHQNMDQVMGEPWYLWWLPITLGTEIDGVNYPWNLKLRSGGKIPSTLLAI